MTSSLFCSSLRTTLRSLDRYCPIVLLLVALAFAGCAGVEKSSGGEPLAIYDVTAVEAYDLLRKKAGDPQFVIVDVRTAEEFSQGHIEGAVLLDYYAPDFRQRITALDRNSTYLVYCRTGNRSRQVVAVMSQLGFRKVYHLSGGIVAWQEKNYPVVK